MKIISIISIMFFFIISGFSQTDQEEYKTAVSYFKKANEYKQKYDFENAKVYFEKAASLFKKNNYTGNYIQSQYSVADICIQNNKFANAESILIEIEGLSIQKYGNDNKFLMNIFYGKGLVAAMKGKHSAAVKYYKKSAELNDKYDKPNSFFKSNLFASLGNAYSELGKIDLALTNYRNDLELKKTYVGENHPMLAVAYNNIANIYMSKGQLDQALSYIDKALNLSVNAYGKDDVRTAKYYSGKGNVFKEKGQYELALEFFQISLEINKRKFGNKHISVAKNLNDIGIVKNKLGSFDEALIYFKDVYDIQIDLLGENHPDIAGTCNNIGFILEFQKKHESSLKYYQKAVDIKKENFGPNHPELAVYYNNIGINYYNRKEYKNALDNYLNAISIIEKNYGTKFPGIVRMYLNVADLYRKEGEYNKSLKYYQKSITANVINFNPDTVDYYVNPSIKNYLDINKLLYSLNGKAGVLEANYMIDSSFNDLKHSAETYLLCDSVISIARNQAVKQSDKIFLGNQTKQIYQSAITILLELADLSDKEKEKQKYFEKAFYISEKNKAVILSQAVNYSDVKSFADIPEEILDEERKLKNVISTVEKELAEASDEKSADGYKNRLFILNEELRSFNSKIETEYPKYFNSKYKDVELDIKELQSNIEKNAAIRSYFLGDDIILIFTVTNDEIKVTSIDKPNDFEQKIKNFNKYITSGMKSDFNNYLDYAFDFYNLFFPDKLPEGIEKLTIIPDGMIGMLPFESLITENYTGEITSFKDYPFLIKDYQVNYAYSAGLLLKSFQNKRRRDNRKSWLGIAPVFENVSEMNINKIKVTPLPGSKNEIIDIETIFKDKELETLSMIEKSATETFFKKENLKDYKYIHIATHGIVNTYEPKLSGILFYPQDSENDGILFSGEIYNLELDADLTVLSACETGLGKISKSEGIIGLSRALMYAGSDNTIVSLWKVSDNSTHDLMVNFYTNLLEDEEDRAKALHLAKLEIIESGETFAHPFFWSPFILIGK